MQGKQASERTKKRLCEGKHVSLSQPQPSVVQVFFFFFRFCCSFQFPRPPTTLHKLYAIHLVGAAEHSIVAQFIAVEVDAAAEAAFASSLCASQTAFRRRSETVRLLSRSNFRAPKAGVRIRGILMDGGEACTRRGYVPMKVNRWISAEYWL